MAIRGSPTRSWSVIQFILSRDRIIYCYTLYVLQKNASTPLSEVYDGKSALEQMHSQLLLRVMRYHGLGVVLDHPKTGLHTRRLLWETILATDMSVHDLFMKNLSGVINGQTGSLFFRRSITCQTLMKCADISNPVRFISCIRLYLDDQLNFVGYLESSVSCCETLGFRVDGRMVLPGPL